MSNSQRAVLAVVLVVLAAVLHFSFCKWDASAMRHLGHIVGPVVQKHQVSYASGVWFGLVVPTSVLAFAVFIGWPKGPSR